MMEKIYVTDLSDRERQRFCSVLERLAGFMDGAGKAIADGNDQKAAMFLAAIALLAPTVVGELVEIFKAGVITEIPGTPEGLS